MAAGNCPIVFERAVKYISRIFHPTLSFFMTSELQHIILIHRTYAEYKVVERTEQTSNRLVEDLKTQHQK